jgi:hypothetical protein
VSVFTSRTPTPQTPPPWLLFHVARSVPICQFNLISKFPYIAALLQTALLRLVLVYIRPNQPILIFCIYDGHSASVAVSRLQSNSLYTSSGCFSSSPLSARLATTDYIKRFASPTHLLLSLLSYTVCIESVRPVL